MNYWPPTNLFWVKSPCWHSKINVGHNKIVEEIVETPEVQKVIDFF